MMPAKKSCAPAAGHVGASARMQAAGHRQAAGRRGARLHNDQQRIAGAELAHVAVHAAHHIRHRLAHRDQHAQQLLCAGPAPGRRSRGSAWAAPPYGPGPPGRLVG